MRSVVSVDPTSAKEGSMSSMASQGVIPWSPIMAKEGSVGDGLEESAMIPEAPEDKAESTLQ